MTPLALSAVGFFAKLGCGSRVGRPVVDVVTRTGDFLNAVGRTVTKFVLILTSWWCVHGFSHLHLIVVRHTHSPLR